MASSTMCTNKESLVAYLYGEVSETERDALGAHLSTCAICATELREMRGVREALSEWTPPEADLGFRIVQQPVAPRARWFWPVPVWAQAAAAACLVLAGAAAIANLEIRYGSDGMIVRTGWSRPDAVASRGGDPSSGAAATPVVTRSELQAAVDRLRSEFDAREARLAAASHDGAQRAVAARGSVGEADMRRIQSLIDQSERRQDQELALRLARLMKDMNDMRRADFARFEQRFGQVQTDTGAAIALTRDWYKNYTNQLVVRASQRQPQ